MAKRSAGRGTREDLPTDLDDLPTEGIEKNAPPTRVFLVVHNAGNADVHALRAGEAITFSRSVDATVCVDDTRVSRFHARVRYDEQGLVVEDLGATNKTRVNGHRMFESERRIAAGDILTIGPIEVHVSYSGKISEPATEGAAPDHALPDGIIVADPAMQRIFKTAARLAARNTTVLLLGETGVGKEIVAQQIHRLSARANQPFLALNCGSVPETLLESALFGHEKGAFTGAHARKVGFFEAANGGTLFLDEVGELRPATQVGLLRVLETRTITPVGGTAEIPVNVHVVCATHRDLPAEIEAGNFREDLYYRINTVSLRIPPLRARKKEIPLLAELFARRFAEEQGVVLEQIDRDAQAVLARHEWPGNIRELRNAMEHAVVLAENGRISVEHLPESVRTIKAAPEGETGELKSRVDELERSTILKALRAENWNQTRAAKALGLSRRGLIYKMDKYGLRKS